ncbi:MAG: hypothetical protein L6Q99_06035 [Planctomycetes bacterium]|nr:hypothetical protein [Planctomycetota bacterium]
MRTSHWILSSFAAVAVLAAAGTAWMKAKTPVAPQNGASSAATVGGVRGLLFAQPYVLDQGFEHTWRAEKPSSRAGWLLVLDVDPDLVVPQEGYEPVLFVGDQTAERVNRGVGSGHLVVIVPADLDHARGEPALDLFVGPMWFGTPRLPEQVDAKAIADEFAAARRAGVRAFASEHVALAKQQGGGFVALKDRTELERYAATLVQTWAPDEYEFAQGLLQPLVK